MEVEEALAERPLRRAELSGTVGDRLVALTARAVEVPPIAAIGHEVELAVRRPGRLLHRLLGAARDLALRGGPAAGVQLAHPYLSSVPGHVGMVPRLPDEPPAVGADLGRRVEVVTARDGDRLPLAVDVEGDNGVDRLGRAGRVVLAHGEYESPGRVHGHVGVADVRRGGDRPRRRVAVLAVEALVFEVGEVERPVFDREVAASVLVDAAAGVVSLGHEVLDATVGVATADDDPPRLVGPQLRPAEVVAVPAEHLVAELDPALVQQEVGRDRRSP